MVNKSRPFSEDIEELESLYGHIYDYSEAVYTGCFGKLKIICKKHGKFEMSLSSHLRGRGCVSCRKEKEAATKLQKFISQSKKVHGDRYDYSKVVYSGSKSLVSIICKVHGEFEQRAESHKSGNGCAQCYNDSIRHTQEQVIQDYKTVHGNLYDYSEVNYKSAKDTIVVICRKHGPFTIVSNTHKNGVGCAKCSNSKGELRILSYLESNKFSYDAQWVVGQNPATGKDLMLDFYIHGRGVGIEFDGIQHHKPVKHFGGRSVFFGVVYRDQVKEDLCQEKGIFLIRIPHTHIDNIEEILDYELNSRISFHELEASGEI